MSKPKSAETKTRIGGVYLHGRIYYAQWMHNGKHYKVSTKMKTEEEALDVLDQLTEPFRLSDSAETAKILADRAAAKAEQLPALRISKIWDEVEKSVKYCDWAEESRKRNKTHVTAFAEWMAQNHPKTVEVRDVTQRQAEEFIRHILDLYKPKTAIEYRAILLQVWDMVKAESKAAENVWKSVQRPAKHSHRRRELTEEEMRKIFSNVKGEMRTLFAIGTYTGLRLGDAVCLRWNCVDFERGTIHTTPKKTDRHGTEVWVSIVNTPLELILKKTPKKKRTGYIVPDLAEKYLATPTGNGGFGKLIKKVFDDCGIQTTTDAEKGRASVDVGFHSLRHTFVSMSANGGVPLAVVQSIVGHTNTQMTQHYYHANKSALDKAAASLPDYIFDKPKSDLDMKIAALERLVSDWSRKELAEGIKLLTKLKAEHKG